MNYVDFLRTRENLAHGGSVFITSKNSQKLMPKKEVKPLRNKNETQKAEAVHLITFKQYLRHPQGVQ